jgi:predicted nucleic-acid-binding protein
VKLTLDTNVLVRLATQDDPAQAALAQALRTLLQVQQVVCRTPAVLAGLSLLESGGDFADGVLAFEGELLGGTEFVSFDRQAVKLLKAQKRKARLLGA